MINFLNRVITTEFSLIKKQKQKKQKKQKKKTKKKQKKKTQQFLTQREMKM